MHLVEQFSLLYQTLHFLRTFIVSPAERFMVICKAVVPHHIVVSHFQKPEAQFHIIIGYPQHFPESSGLPEHLCPDQETGSRHGHTILCKTVPSKIVASVILHKL